MVSHYHNKISTIFSRAALVATTSSIVISNCNFENLLSYNDGGAFHLNNNNKLNGSNLNFYNTTSLKLVKLNIYIYTYKYIIIIHFVFITFFFF